MSWWSLIPAVLSIGADFLGSKEAEKGTEEGMQEQIRIEGLKREYATKIFNEDIERQKPFYDAGVKAGIKYPDAITNKIDPTQSGAYKTQLDLISPGLENAPEYVKKDAIARLGAVEGEKIKNRLMDLQQIGLGAAGSAGTGSLNLGNVLAQSYGLADRVQKFGEQSMSDQNQSAWNVAASQLSGIPAYLAANKSPAPPLTQYNQFNRTSQPGGIGGY